MIKTYPKRNFLWLWSRSNSVVMFSNCASLLLSFHFSGFSFNLDVLLWRCRCTGFWVSSEALWLMFSGSDTGRGRPEGDGCLALMPILPLSSWAGWLTVSCFVILGVGSIVTLGLVSVFNCRLGSSTFFRSGVRDSSGSGFGWLGFFSSVLFKLPSFVWDLKEQWKWLILFYLSKKHLKVIWTYASALSFSLCFKYSALCLDIRHVAWITAAALPLYVSRKKRHDRWGMKEENLLRYMIIFSNQVHKPFEGQDGSQ